MADNATTRGTVADLRVTRRRFLIGGAAVGGALMLGGCGSEASSGASEAAGGASEASSAAAGGGGGGGGLKIVHVPKWTTFPYFQAANTGAEKAAEELGDTVTYTGPTEPNAEQQVATLQTVLAQQPDVIMLAAIEPDNVAPVLTRAMQQGITVVTYDADCQKDARNMYCNQLTYELAAESYLDAALMNDPEGGGVAFMAATPTTANHIGQIDAMKALIQKGGKYGVFEAGETYFVEDDVAKSVDTMTNIMQSDPSVKYMLSGSAVSVPAACQAIEAAGKKGEVWATGAALPGDIKPYLENGIGKAFALWDPSELGYMAAYAGHLIASGDLEVAEGTSWEAGELGEFTIAADNITNYNKPIIFTPDNINDYNW